MKLTDIDKYLPNFSTKDSGWIRFHKELDKIFSRKEANKYWLQAWSNYGGDANYNANTSDLREYMSGKGVELTAPTTWQGITDTAWDFYKTIRIIVWVAAAVLLTVIALRIYFGGSRTTVNTK